MTYFLLTLFFLAVLFITYKLLNKDFLSPSILSILFYTAAIFFSFIGIFSWNTEVDLNIKTIFI